ncbi:hypothetical protein [Sorangium sp. So ce542]|uniref:hypothetical protein n=1 Tax=Sorangium sp. So ce542 TaxID=3133316 RepID=UPI003F6389A0
MHGSSGELDDVGIVLPSTVAGTPRDDFGYSNVSSALDVSPARQSRLDNMNVHRSRLNRAGASSADRSTKIRRTFLQRVCGAAALLGGVLHGCGGDGSDPGGLGLEDFVRVESELHCRLSYDCCSAAALDNPFLATSKETCVQFRYGIQQVRLLPILRASAAAGRLVYHPDRMRACVDRLNGAGCAATDADWLCLRDVFEGQVPLGGECTVEHDCENWHCVKPDPDAEVGTCAPWSPDGAVCETFVECDSGRCDIFGTDTCGPRLPEGSDCVLGPDCETYNCLEDTGTCGPPLDDNGCPVDGLLLDNKTPAGSWY